VQAHAKVQPLAELCLEAFAPGVHALANELGRAQRLTAGGGQVGLEAEDRHHAVADELVGHAAAFAHGGTHRCKVAVEHIGEVERPLPLRQPRPAPQVHEQNGHVALAAEAADRRGAAAIGRRRKQRSDLDVAAGPQLAGQPHVAGRTHALQRSLLVTARLADVFGGAEHAHAAGRAARTPAAHRKMGNAVRTARFQHAPAARHLHGASGVAQRNRKPARPARQPVACSKRCQQGGQAKCVEDLDAGFHGVERAALRRVRHHCGRHAGPLELASHGDEAHRRGKGQHDCQGKQQMGEAAVARPCPQRKVHADAAVDPGREHHGELRRGARQVPPAPNHARIGTFDAVGLVGAAHGRHVGDQQQRQREAQQNAQALQRRHAQRAALPQRGHGKRQVNGGGAVQQQRARQAVPEELHAAQHRLGRGKGDDTQRMVQQMRRHIGHQHQPARPAEIAPGRQSRQKRGLGGTSVHERVRRGTRA
jgi:hypothetical protein